MRDVMNSWKATFPIVGDVRGLGPMMLAEFVSDREAKVPATPEQTLQIARQAVANGVVIMRAGLYSNCIRLLPPLVMPEDMLNEGLDVVGHAIEMISIPMPALQREAAELSDVLLYKGQVLTQATPLVVSAVAVRDGRIAAIGDSVDLLRAADARTKRIDLGGRTIVPGFNDAHAHIWKIRHLLTSMLDLRRVTSVAQLVDDVQRFAERLAGDVWLLGRGMRRRDLIQ